MMNKVILIVAALIFGVALLNPFFIVDQTEQAIVLQFGKPVEFKDGDKKVKFINTPGLKLKIPLVQDVVFFDNRILDFSATDKEVLDLEKKNLTVNAFAKYKIVDPLVFYQKVTDERGLNARLDKVFEASLRDAIGKILITQLLTDERKQILKSIKDDFAEEANDFGVAVYDVRIVRADLPPENSEAIYKRMRAEREKEAREHRAEGEKQAEILRGEADAKAIQILADAYNQDPEFYSFYRSMQAYRTSFLGMDAEQTNKSVNPNSQPDAANAGNTTFVLSPESEFMRYFKNIEGK